MGSTCTDPGADQTLDVFKNFIEIYLIYNAVFISAVWQSITVIFVFSFIFFSIVVYHKILNIVPCAVQ